MDIFKQAAAIQPLDQTAMEAAIQRQKQLVKPMGSLGRLEDFAIQIAGITGQVYNQAERKRLYLFGADNGVYEEGIAATPQHFTKMLLERYADGQSCAINVLCHQGNVQLQTVDLGVKGGTDHPDIWHHRLMDGTRNFTKEPAMDRETAVAAMTFGFDCARQAKTDGIDILGGGEVGMGNTTTAAACIMAACGKIDPADLVGRGAGLTDQAFARKKEVIGGALKQYALSPEDPVGILSAVGGLDIAALTGLYLGCGYYRLPVVLDGVISMAAALLAYRLNPLVKGYLLPSHLSEEPAYCLAASEMGLEPVLALHMRLGEGSGCPLLMQLLQTALAVMNQMTTFEEEQLPSDYREPLKNGKEGR